MANAEQDASRPSKITLQRAYSCFTAGAHLLVVFAGNGFSLAAVLLLSIIYITPLASASPAGLSAFREPAGWQDCSRQQLHTFVGKPDGLPQWSRPLL